ncbi:hypothetical protein BH24ACT5_BH24ACT5_13970 [soil metagenome]
MTRQRVAAARATATPTIPGPLGRPSRRRTVTRHTVDDLAISALSEV